MAGATGYNVKRSTVSGGPYTIIATNLTSLDYTDTGLTAGTTFYYIVIAQKLVAESARSAQASATALTAMQAWRQTYFGTTNNTGKAADTFDANGDGGPNLMEFATWQNPNAATSAPPALIRNGTNLEYTYTRSNAALADAVAFIVEWRKDLTTGAWSNGELPNKFSPTTAPCRP